MYTYVCVCLLFVFVRVAPWNVYIELFIVLRLRLCFVWVNKLWFTLDFITCSRIFLIVSRFVSFTYTLSPSLCAFCFFFMYSIFNFDFTDYHLLLLIAYRVENLQWFFSFDDFTRCGIGCCCCGYLLLVVVVVKLVRFVFNLLIWLCWVSFYFFY